MREQQFSSRPSRRHLHLLPTAIRAGLSSIVGPLAVVVSIICFVGLACAAEITIGQTVVLEGKIEPGDYDKLRDFLVVNRDYGINDAPCSAIYLDGCPDEIYLASPGGDVAEAMKIGRLVRTLGWTAIVPTNTAVFTTGAEVRQKEIDRHDLGDPNSNYMCASACFFIFVGAIFKETDILSSEGPPLLGIHQPYLSTESLRELNGTEAVAAANFTKGTVENYLKEMAVPIKYLDQMFSVPKDKIQWISDNSFDADFRGLIPGLRDWLDAKCDKRTDIEKAAWDSIAKKDWTKLTPDEKYALDLLTKKNSQQIDCEEKAKFGLRKEAWERWRKEALQKIADTCAARKSTLPSELAAALSVAAPNQHSARVALNLAQTAALCKNYSVRESAVRLLANRGDARAQRILGNLYFFGTNTIAKDQIEGMTWFDRAGAQGDLVAKKFHRDLSGVFAATKHSFTDQENIETGRWIERNCPALC